MNVFDYSAPAELFRHSALGTGVTLYRRFNTAADALGFAIEELGDLDRHLVTVEVDEVRLDQRAIRALYDAVEYPLTRKRTH
jgi:hypothetical protein